MFGKIRERSRIFQCLPGKWRMAPNRGERNGEDMEKDDAPLCPICKINPREYDSEPPGPGSYFSHCYRCSSLVGTRDHSHTYYGSPAQVAAGTYRADQSWRTTVTLHPIIENDRHVGFRCVRFDECGWEHRFTAEELEPCSHVNNWGFPYETIKGLCANGLQHRQERGELDERGWITDYGREREQLRSDADNWDPGKYIDRTPVD